MLHKSLVEPPKLNSSTQNAQMIWFGKFPGAKPNLHPTTGASQNTSLNHPIGSSDGRCVQRAGTARAAPDIEGHHRPVIALFRAAFNLPVPLRSDQHKICNTVTI
ncbi:hypothetical protein T10_13333 [Trichinella papuae]|uniref:Uncharacterized protein n=1 Tax=Trichinella papuae TaxID=268474 RepID=A0A0V1M3S4_9BILA|nr:hypothetical protein T10_9123 [Trichinella papuae]KRZ66277.1 hypothetical protein T10_13333 [Trichinella papuae]